MKDYQAMIFDLDGTLIDSMWVWRKIDEVYLAQLNYEVPEDIEEALEGMSFTESATYFKTRFQIEDTIDEIKEAWNDLAWQFYTEEVPLKKGVQAFLEYATAQGIKLGIATSNSTKLVHAVLKKHGIDHLFESIRTSCEVEKGKPHPYIYLKVAEDLGVAPENCLVFEDVANGVRAGKAAGMDVWAVEDGQSEETKIVLNQLAERMVLDFDEAMRLLK